MTTEQFRKRTSALKLPEAIYDLYDSVVKACDVCLKSAPPPSRSRISGIRATNFGDIIFMDHCEVSVLGINYYVLIILDGATHLVWAAPQKDLGEELTQESIREWIDNFQCVPKAAVADMAFHTKSFERFYRFHGIKPLATGPRTPWPNRAESAVRLFKAQFSKLAEAVKKEPLLTTCTCRSLVRACTLARNSQVLVGGKTPLELAFGRPLLVGSSGHSPALTVVRTGARISEGPASQDACPKGVP